MPEPFPQTPKLPQPRPPLDAKYDPFVGNETVDDNLSECVRIALWNALGDLHGSLEPVVNNGVVSLDGSVTLAAHRDAAETAARSIAGVVKVINRIAVFADNNHPPAKGREARQPSAVSMQHIAKHPMVYLIRYCSVGEASISAAVRQGLPILDEFLTSNGQAHAHQLFVIYRNHLRETVTLEIGVPVDAITAKRAMGELRTGATPGGASMSRRTGNGLSNLLSAEAQLIEMARRSGVACQACFWQSFAPADFRPWHGHPQAAVHLPVVPRRTNVRRQSKTLGA
jgi:hypothetical protein